MCRINDARSSKWRFILNYIFSDLHLNHKAVIGFEGRPFSSVYQMNKTILRNWRETVSSRDTIWVLGDVAFSTTKEELTSMIKNLPGIKKLILGNHDRSKSLQWWRDVGFVEVYPYPIIYQDFFILSHEPVYVSKEMPYVNIHGHTHSESSDNPQKVNVSVEVTGYAPVSLDDIITRRTKEKE